MGSLWTVPAAAILLRSHAASPPLGLGYIALACAVVRARASAAALIVEEQLSWRAIRSETKHLRKQIVVMGTGPAVEDQELLAPRLSIRAPVERNVCARGEAGGARRRNGGHRWSVIGGRWSENKEKAPRTKSAGPFRYHLPFATDYGT